MLEKCEQQALRCLDAPSQSHYFHHKSVPHSAAAAAATNTKCSKKFEHELETFVAQNQHSLNSGSSCLENLLNGCSIGTPQYDYFVRISEQIDKAVR